MNSLNSLMDNKVIVKKIQNIYKYIDDNDVLFDEILDYAFEDLRNIYAEVRKINDAIEITSTEPDSIEIAKNRCLTFIKHHAEIVLGDNKYIAAYAYNIKTFNNSKGLLITKKKH